MAKQVKRSDSLKLSPCCGGSLRHRLFDRTDYWACGRCDRVWTSEELNNADCPTMSVGEAIDLIRKERGLDG